MLVIALMKGSGYHVIFKVANNDGHEAWTKIQDLYGLAATRISILNHYNSLPELQTLYEKTTASYNLNIFSIIPQKLEDKNEEDAPESKLTQFLNNITDNNYDVLKQQLSGNPDTTFDTAVTQI